MKDVVLNEHVEVEIKEKSLKQKFTEHMAKWAVHFVEGQFEFPLWSAIMEISVITWIVLIISSLRKENRGKVLDWVDKV